MFKWNRKDHENPENNSDDIPDYLLGSLFTWINNAEIFVSFDPGYFQTCGELRIGSTQRMLNLQAYERVTKSRCPYFSEDCTAQYFSENGISDDQVYKFIDFLCRRIGEQERSDNYYGSMDFQDMQYLYDTRQKILDSLSKILIEGGSPYCLKNMGRGYRLEKRVDPVMQKSIDGLGAMGSDAEEIRHLQKAWDKTFGRDPDYQYAYGEIIRAVEAVICPLVEPDNNKATLSSVAGVMRSQQGWHYVIEPKDEHAQVAGGFMRLAIEALMNNHQQRHAGGGDNTPVSEEQTKGALYMAVTILQAVHDGLITRGGKKKDSLT
ncbi:hypothetical protein [Bifidobacterium psychraerophilum]|uniref:hypothetical protein n=1 Tax=Bifidobacterium psychraerophilum TaxID=218140 RepID=UPI0039EAB5B9